MSRQALIVYHKNAESIYPKAWIDQFRDSILNQTFKDFDIYEFNYGGDQFRIFENSTFFSRKYDNFVEVMNWLLEVIFHIEDYDYAFNSNIDDYYSIYRFEKQMPYLEQGYGIVSSNFALINEEGVKTRVHEFDKLNIEKELNSGHNIIAHPVVAYSKDFWRYNKYNAEEIPTEDLLLWKRGIEYHAFIVMPDCLLFHRIHTNSVCNSDNR